MRNRKYVMLLMGFLLSCIPFAEPLMAQQKGYDWRETFNPVVYSQGNVYRTATGKPGAQYWQNECDYVIKAEFDTLSRVLRAKMTVTYTNNSPDTLDEVWFVLGQNRFRKDSRSRMLTPVQGSRFGIDEVTDGFVLNAVQEGAGKAFQKASYQISNDQLKLKLKQPLKPKGKVALYIDYHFTLPFNGSDFMGILPSPHGSIYQLSSWFPRMLVYDNVNGWNPGNSGYYIEPGKMDYEISVPSEMIVQGTGTLINPAEVLTKTQLARLQQAKESELTVQIRGPKELTVLGGSGKKSSWHFSSEQTGDAAFAISRAFIWDAVRVNLPDQRKALAMSLYPPESNIPSWQQSAQTMKQVLETYSRLWAPYPYSSAVNIAGSITGIGAPGLSMIHYKSDGMANGVWAKVNHEMGHTWFNMMVAGNGKQGWMVEGLNSFINHVNGDTLGGQTAFAMQDCVDWLAKVKATEPVTTPLDMMQADNFALLAYMKPAAALHLLRTQVLGPERFDPAFRTFIKDWTFKHPTPEDFFRSMEYGSGEELSWFWRSWFLNDWKLDQGISGVSYVDGSVEKGILIKLLNKGKMVMPVVIEVIEFNGKTSRITLPAQIWQRTAEWSFHYPSTSTVISVKLDPDQVLPDAERSDNFWQASGTPKPVPAGLNAAMVIENYLKAIGGRERIGKLKSVALSYHQKISGMEYLFERTATFPGKYSMGLGFSNFAARLQQYDLNASSVSYQSFGSPVPLDAGQDEQLRQVCTFFPELFLSAASGKLSLSDSTAFVNGMDAYVLNLSKPTGENLTYYYEVKTGLKIRESYAGAKPENLPYQRLELGGYQNNDGLLFPDLLIVKKINEADLLLKEKKFSISSDK